MVANIRFYVDKLLVRPKKTFMVNKTSGRPQRGYKSKSLSREVYEMLLMT
jgi:hypothetical protein